MKKKIAIYGAGGLGREIAWMLKDIEHHGGEWELIGFFDDEKKRDAVIDELPILGGLREINATVFALNLVIAISSPVIKEKLVSQINNPAIEFPSLIHPACLVGDRERNGIGRGTILTAGVILTTGIHLGDFVLLNLATTVGHDVKISNFCSVMPGVSLSGAVSLGERCTVGTGARILQNISIGPDCTIGAGAVVTKSFEAGSILIGVPAARTL